MQTKTNRFRSRYVTRVFNKSHFEMITRYTPRYDWPCAGYQWRGKLKINFYRVCASARLHTIDDNNNCLRPHTRTIGVFTKMVSDGFRTLISGRPSVRPWQGRRWTRGGGGKTRTPAVAAPSLLSPPPPTRVPPRAAALFSAVRHRHGQREGMPRVVARASCTYACESSRPGRASCEECGWSGESARVGHCGARRAETKL